MRKFILLNIFITLHFIIACHAQVIELVKEINPAGNSYPYGFTVCNNKLFFIAGDNVNYNKLYVSQGTPATTQLLGPAMGAINSFYNLFSFNNKLFFSFNDNVHGQELWVSDGTVAGTVLFKDIYAGASGSFPYGFTIANNKLFFIAEDINGQRKLYVSDGTPAGTTELNNKMTDLFNGYTGFAVLNNEIYFRSDNGTGSGYGLWKSDGTAAGTVLLLPDIIAGTSGGNYAVLNNKLYFSVADNIYGSELWVSDGTGLGTHIVKNLSADGVGVYGNGAPYSLTVFNSKIYFAAHDDDHGTELFVTDGTDAGTHIVKDILPGTNSSSPRDLKVYNGSLYIISSTLGELLKTDGTDAGTTVVKTAFYSDRFGAVWNNKMYFPSSIDYSMLESDGTTAGTITATASNSPNAVSIYGSDLVFTEYNSGLYFSGNCSPVTSGFEPCRFTSTTPVPTNFTFSGAGNWSNPANWSGGIVPPATLPSGSNIVITGNCILDVTQHIQMGATLTVASGANLVIMGSLNIL